MIMKIDAKKIMDRAKNASTGVAVAAAFFNIALIVIRLVETVSEEADRLKDEESE
jgi:hypothetical protein